MEASHPRILNLGSGKDWREDCFNVDIKPNVNPDWVHDFSKPIAWGWPYHETQRFGRYTPKEESFDTIIANDVLEHIPDLVCAMTNCLKLLRTGGSLFIQVPYDLSYGAWQDPTHVRAFNERSWWYYTVWYWYLGWTTHRFEQRRLEWIISEVGIKRLAAKIPCDDEFVRTPRMIDAMKVELVKIAV